MKRILLTMAVLALLPIPVLAKTIQVESLQDFTTVNPSKQMAVKLHENIFVDEGRFIPRGMVIVGDITGVKSPKRLKRDAAFSFIPRYYIDAYGEKVEIEKHYVGKFTTKLNKTQIAKSAALTVGNHFVQGLSTGVHLVEGVVKNEEGNRAKSGIKSVYDNSPFSYVEEGKDIEIKQNQLFLLNFKTKDDKVENKPNYQYEMDVNLPTGHGPQIPDEEYQPEE